MTCPADRFVAAAFWEACKAYENQRLSYAGDLIAEVIGNSEQLEAEAGGADALDSLPVEETPVVSTGTVVSRNKIACPIPTCRAEMLPGKTCGGEFCGLKVCVHPGCATPTTPEPCGYAACPRR